jgi:hypothetical protein
MASTTLALVVVTGLCFAFSSTRWLGLLGLFLLFTFFPISSSILTLLAGGVFLYVRHHQRSKHHDRKKLHD